MSKTVTVKRPDIPTSRLQGWDFINSLIKECPLCNHRAALGNPVYSNKWRVCCMNICCPNDHITDTYDNPFMAIHEWNQYAGDFYD